MRLAAAALALALAAAGCTHADERQADQNVRSAATALAQSASGAVRAIRSGAGRAEGAVDRSARAARAALPPVETGARNFATAAAVKARLVAIDPASAVATTVVAAGDLVHLSGRVKSVAIEARFRRAATSVPGIASVDTQLVLDPALPSPVEPARDLALDAVVRANMAAAAGLAAASASVRARGSDVSLTGTVPDAATRATLERAARATPGVGRVDDALRVK